MLKAYVDLMLKPTVITYMLILGPCIYIGAAAKIIDEKRKHGDRWKKRYALFETILHLFLIGTCFIFVVLAIVIPTILAIIGIFV